MIAEPEIKPSDKFKTSEAMYYYNILNNKKVSLLIKRLFDIVVSFFMLILLSVFLIAVAVIIKLDSSGTVFYRQERITKYGKKFKIYKFRTMVSNADKIGTLVTVKNDMRITRIGKILRKYRIDEVPQLINILKGEMTFVGTRPEVEKYVNEYSNEMYATLLMPAGVTSLASIFYKDEDRLLESSENADDTYINEILPKKMKYNLNYIKNFSFFYDIKIMFMTFFAVCRSNNESNQIDNKPEDEKVEIG